jgi:ceramide glucosyltransferase
MIHYTIRFLEIAAVLGCASSSCYYFLCLWSAAAFLREEETAGVSARPTQPTAQAQPPVSILKPLKGTDPEIYESFRSHCLQDYPDYEIVFGVSDPTDPAVASVRRLQQEFPYLPIKLVLCLEALGANVKVSNLDQMLRVARHPMLLVNDSDIRVEPDYLRRVTAPLGDPTLGVVTCLYRGVAAETLSSRLEALGISTDFCAGVLVARQLEGGLNFALGSTMVFRRTDLERIGGFRAIVDFLADDYELGRRIAGLGLKTQLSHVVVETHLPAYNAASFLEHQLRWGRGVRDARAGGYFGLVSTFGLMWALLNLIAVRGAGWAWSVLCGVAALRAAVAIVVGRSVLRDRTVVKDMWLLPVRDLMAAGIWAVSLFGHTVTWRGDRFRLKNGRLTRIAD